MTRDPKPAESEISRGRLARILGLGAQADASAVEAALPRLLIHLGRKLARAEGDEAARLREEIADLATSSARIAAANGPSATANKTPHREARLGATLGFAFALVLLLGYAAGFRIIQSDPSLDEPLPSKPGVLILEGPLTGGTLRVLDADREELLVKIAADWARVELEPGRVALDVRREDCPDRWTRSVYFEEGSTHRFEPKLCLGSGRLTIRSNVSGDRLRIDGLDFGATSEAAHPLRVGDHTLQVDKAGYEPFVGTVRIRPDEELEIRVELVKQGEAEPTRGRPMPVTKQAPTDSPIGGLVPAPLDMAADVARVRQGVEKPDLDLAKVPLPSLDRLLPSGQSTRSTGGSTRWHDRVSAAMLDRYDLDRSGQIDQLDESESISCGVWRDLEKNFDEGGLGLSMARYFGFDGSEWHPNALGFARSHRSAAFAKMQECGLRT